MAPALIRTILALALVTVGGLAATSGAAPPGLSTEQQRRLAAGEIVVLDTLPPGASGSARGGTAVGLVRAAPERVWPVLVDFPGQPRFYPRLVSAEVVEANAQRALVRYEVASGPLTFGFHLIQNLDPARRRLEWYLDPNRANNFFRESVGYWEVDPAEGGSLVTYAIGVRTVLPGFVSFGSERASLAETITGLRKLVEN